MMYKNFKELLTLFPTDIKHLMPGPGKLIIRFIEPEQVDTVVDGGIIIPTTVKMKNPQDLLKMGVVIAANYKARDAFTMYFEDVHKEGRFGEGSIIYINGLSGVHFQRLDPATEVASSNDLNIMYGIISFQEILFFDFERRLTVLENGIIKEIDLANTDRQE